jgi:hypothetical protein
MCSRPALTCLNMHAQTHRAPISVSIVVNCPRRLETDTRTYTHLHSRYMHAVHMVLCSKDERITAQAMQATGT